MRRLAGRRGTRSKSLHQMVLTHLCDVWLDGGGQEASRCTKWYSPICATSGWTEGDKKQVVAPNGTHPSVRHLAGRRGTRSESLHQMVLTHLCDVWLDGGGQEASRCTKWYSPICATSGWTEGDKKRVVAPNGTHPSVRHLAGRRGTRSESLHQMVLTHLCDVWLDGGGQEASRCTKWYSPICATSGWTEGDKKRVVAPNGTHPSVRRPDRASQRCCCCATNQDTVGRTPTGTSPRE